MPRCFSDSALTLCHVIREVKIGMHLWSQSHQDGNHKGTTEEDQNLEGQSGDLKARMQSCGTFLPGMPCSWSKCLQTRKKETTQLFSWSALQTATLQSELV